MSTKLVRLVLVFALVILSAGVIAAQDTTTTTGGVTCDEDLILSLYVAQRYLGFNDVRNGLTSSGVDPTTQVDLSAFNFGQYQPLFDNINNSSGVLMEATAEAGATTSFIQPGQHWNEQWATGVTSSLMQDDATFNQNFMSSAFPNSDPSTVSPLVSTGVAGEAAECAQLRTELNRFYDALAFQDLSSSMAIQSQ
jgi:hypothetical protein